MKYKISKKVYREILDLKYEDIVYYNNKYYYIDDQNTSRIKVLLFSNNFIELYDNICDKYIIIIIDGNYVTSQILYNY